MDFNKKIRILEKMLFIAYVRCDKIKETDWFDDALFIASEITMLTERTEGIDRISNYLKNKYKDDSYTDFVNLSTSIFDKYIEIECH